MPQLSCDSDMKERPCCCFYLSIYFWGGHLFSELVPYFTCQVVKISISKQNSNRLWGCVCVHLKTIDQSPSKNKSYVIKKKKKHRAMSCWVLTPSEAIITVQQRRTILQMERVMLRFPPDLVLLCLFPLCKVICQILFLSLKKCLKNVTSVWLHLGIMWKTVDAFKKKRHILKNGI